MSEYILHALSGYQNLPRRMLQTTYCSLEAALIEGAKRGPGEVEKIECRNLSNGDPDRDIVGAELERLMQLMRDEGRV